MILADSSVWVDHLRVGDGGLTARLDHRMIAMHPFVIGELALGNLRQRRQILSLLQGLPGMVMARDEEVLAFIDGAGLAGQGIGYIDCHLLASVKLTADTRLWTRDRRLARVAHDLGLGADPA